jgi:ubiquinone/menaquinone biosynthesis C-methylase UbiE
MGKQTIRKPYNEKLLAWRYGLVERHIQPHDKVLDLGAGTGWVAQRVAERKGCQVHLVDVLDVNETNLPLRVYDGRSIPYEDKSFDTTMLVFVLHHALNQAEILQEVSRVTRRRIIIVEDTPRNMFELVVNKVCDTLGSFQHGFSDPHNYHKIEAWTATFRELGLSLAHQEVIPPFFPFYYTKALFVLAASPAVQPPI